MKNDNNDVNKVEQLPVVTNYLKDIKKVLNDLLFVIDYSDKYSSEKIEEVLAEVSKTEAKINASNHVYTIEEIRKVYPTRILDSLNNELDKATKISNEVKLDAPAFAAFDEEVLEVDDNYTSDETRELIDATIKEVKDSKTDENNNDETLVKIEESKEANPIITERGKQLLKPIAVAVVAIIVVVIAAGLRGKFKTDSWGESQVSASSVTSENIADSNVTEEVIIGNTLTADEMAFIQNAEAKAAMLSAEAQNITSYIKDNNLCPQDEESIYKTVYLALCTNAQTAPCMEVTEQELYTVLQSEVRLIMDDAHIPAINNTGANPQANPDLKRPLTYMNLIPSVEIDTEITEIDRAFIQYFDDGITGMVNAQGLSNPDEEYRMAAWFMDDICQITFGVLTIEVEGKTYTANITDLSLAAKASIDQSIYDGIRFVKPACGENYVHTADIVRIDGTGETIMYGVDEVSEAITNYKVGDNAMIDLAINTVNEQQKYDELKSQLNETNALTR